MKALRITFILALLFLAFASCTKQDLNEDDVLVTDDSQETYFTGGGVDER